MATSSHKPAPKAPKGEIALSSERRTQLIDVTPAVAKMVHDSGVRDGICHLFVPHTTAGILVNEHDDPDVATDIEAALDRLVAKDAAYRHAEGNSDSHIKVSLVGTSAQVFIAEGRLELGRWQGIFFCEFDGPRQRTLCIKIVPD